MSGRSNSSWTTLDQINYDLKIEPQNYSEIHGGLLVETTALLPRCVQGAFDIGLGVTRERAIVAKKRS